MRPDLLMISLLAFFVQSCTTALQALHTDRPDDPTKYEIRRDVTFTPEEHPSPQLADFYKPKSASPTPAIILIHGGGWTGADNRPQMGGIARSLAARGFAVLNITYRKAPHWRHPAQFDDARFGLDWLEKNAVHENIDPAGIAAFGYSAGAHLATLLAFREPGRVRAVVGGGTPAKLMLFNDGKLVRQLTGGTRAEKRPIYEDASPINFVTRKSPPVFLFHGSDDELVPPEHARLLAAELQKKKVAVTLRWIEGRGHIAAFLFSDGSLSEAYAFLEKHL
jgi:acetyl esterase/lipase